MGVKRAAEEAQAAPAQKKSAASGASPPSVAPPVSPLSLTDLLERESSTESGEFKQWVHGLKTHVDQALIRFLRENQSKVPFAVPETCSLIPPLAITQASSSGSALSAFREVMNFDNMVTSFSRAAQYEAAGTVWMLDPVCADHDDVSVSQLEGAMGMWTAETYVRSSATPGARRVSFDVPLPVKVVDKNVAQRAEPGKTGVCVPQPLPMLAGRAVLITWYAAIMESLQQGNDERTWYLFNAALSVPIRLRLLPDGDQSKLAALTFGEAMFAAYAASGADSFWKLAERVCGLSGVKEALNESVSKAESVLKKHGLAFKGHPLSTANVTALKSLQLFVLDVDCRSAYALAEVYSPELRDPTLLSKIASACASRGASDAKAKAYFVYVMDSLRVARLTGDIPKDEKLTVGRVCGTKKQPGMIHALFKKTEFVEYVYHEASLMDQELSGPLANFTSPLKIMQKFGTSGADGLVASYRKQGSAAHDGMETLFALQVAKFRDGLDPKPQAMIDVAWPLWSGIFDEDVQELTLQDFQATSGSAGGGFLWHSCTNETNHELGGKYRAFEAACTARPIAAGTDEDQNLGLTGTSELGQEQKAELHKLVEQLKLLRRKSAQFVSLPVVGGAVGPEFAHPQLQSMWESINYGHRFTRKKGDVRAFVVSAELFPPNLAKQGAKARLSEPMAADEEELKRVLEFLASKRVKDDVIIMFDGRGRANRRVIEELEEKLGSGDSHQLVECWCVYVPPTRTQDPRAAARSPSYTSNTREVAYFSMPMKGKRNVMPRSLFNACGESSSEATTYTGIAMRRFSELPRMNRETKSSILGAPACASLGPGQSRLQAEIDEKGHPFSYAEVKPITLWQDVVAHLGITHIVDLTPGSGAFAVAATGLAQYEGIAANDAHRDWLDSIVDRCVMYQAGQDQGYAGETLGGDAEFVSNASKYFNGLMEARRWLMPDAGEGDEEQDGGVGEDDDDEDLQV